MASRWEEADSRLEAAVRDATFATVLGLALTLGCLLIVRLLNPQLVADGALSLNLRQGIQLNWDLLGLLGIVLLLLLVGVLPSLLARNVSAALSFTRAAAGSIALALLVYLTLVIGLPLLTGQQPHYLAHFFSLVGGAAMAGAWLLALTRPKWGA